MNSDQNKKAVKSFESYVKGKRTEQQGGCQFRTKKKKKNEDVDVTVNIGFKYLNDGKLKTVKAKRLPITVPQSANYNTLREKAINKWMHSIEILMQQRSMYYFWMMGVKLFLCLVCIFL